MMGTKVFDESKTFFIVQNVSQRFSENISKCQSAVVIQTAWNDLAISQNGQLMSQTVACAFCTVIRRMFIWPFKELVEIHIGMRGNGVAVNFAYIGINRLRQVLGLFKGFKNKMIAHALVGIHSAVQIPEPETDISR